MTRVFRRSHALALLVALAPASFGTSGFSAAAAARKADCAPVGELHFICGLHHPEDLVQIPGTPWVVVSNLGGALPGSPPEHGDLYLLNASRLQWRSIAQEALAAQQRNASLYGDCPAPDAALFESHGLAIRAGRQGQHTLYVVNHGGRESVEVFHIDARGAQPRFTWEGCAVLQAGAWLNALAPLPDEGFIVTSTFGSNDPQARDKMGRGEYAGAVYQWGPGKGFTPLTGTGATGDNGVALSADGRWLYLNWFFGHQVIRMARGGGANRVVVTLDFLPDNIHRAPDGGLYVTGQNADPKQLMAGCTGADCRHATTIIKLDPHTMKVRLVAHLPANPLFSDGTTALQVGDRLFIGSYRGDALAYMKVPK